MTDVVAPMEGIAMIPEHCRVGMLRYIEQRIRPGLFLSAILSGDLASALRHADRINIDRLDDYLDFLETYAPHACFGSPRKFEVWIAGKKSRVYDDD